MVDTGGTSGTGGITGTNGEIGDVKGHVVICGWSSTVPRIVDGLSGAESLLGRTVVLVNEHDPAAVAQLRLNQPALNIHHVVGPYHLDLTLRRAACGTAGAVLIVADDAAGTDVDNRTIICTLAVRSLSREVKTCAELVGRDKEEPLRRAGIDEIVIADEHSGFFLSAGALTPGLTKAGRKLVRFRSGSELRRVPIPPEFVDRTFGELQEHVRQDGAMVIGIVREAVSATMDNIFSGADWIDKFITDSFKAVGEEAVDEEKEPLRVIVNPPDDFTLISTTLAKDSAILIGGSARHG